jgi:UDPglucose 6-dehydrogenase
MQIAVFGAGYVGLVQAVGLAELDHEVFLVDIDEAKVEALQGGSVPFYEPGLEDALKSYIASGALRIETSLDRNPELAFVCVQTPQLGDGSCNIAAVKSVLASAHLPELVVIKSTLPPTEFRVLEVESNCELAMNPEFLREGTAFDDFLNPDRIVLGVRTPEAEQVLCSVYEKLEAPKLVMSPESASLTKYAANTMLASRLSLINEIANIAEVVGADMDAVREGLGSDPRIGRQFLRSGAGFGGSCFPKDVLALATSAHASGYDSKLIRPVIEVNEEQAGRFVAKIEQELGGVNGKRIAVWGLAFNKNTDDIRESPAMRAVKLLLAKGVFLSVYDPEAMQNARAELGSDVHYAADVLEACDDADALAALTEWDEFKEVEWPRVAVRMKGGFVFDGKSFLDRASVERSGLKYAGVGVCD